MSYSYPQQQPAAPVFNPGYYDVPIQNQYSNPNPMNQTYPSVGAGDFNPMIQSHYPNGGYTVQPSNVETFVGSRESTYKYIGNSGYTSTTNPYAMSINHSNDQFPVQVYTNTGVQLRVDPRMSSSKIEDAAYKAKTQGMGGGYAQQFAPNNPFTMPQYGMNYQNPSSGMGMWSFEPPYAEPMPTFPAVPAQMMVPMLPPPQYQQQQQANIGRPTPAIRIKDEDSDVEVEERPKRVIKRKVVKKSTMEKVNDFLTDNTTIYWLVVLLFILMVAFVIKSVYVPK